MTVRRFRLCRDVDPTGVTGTGMVAEGAMFDDGFAALRWSHGPASTSVWTTMSDLEKIHGHEGDTRIVWVDEDGVDTDDN